MKLGYPTITWGGVVGTPGGVTSIKDLFYRANGATGDALRAISAAGYTGTEMFDGNLLDYAGNPSELTDLLDDTGLDLVGVYTGANFIYSDILDDEFAKIERSISLAAQFGAKRLVIGGGAVRARGPVPGDYERLADGLDRAAGLAAAAGLESSFHPHMGTLAESPEGLSQLMSLSGIDLCPDTAHIAGGGGDPAETVRRYGHRLAHVHLKDWDYATSTFQPLGRGDLDFAEILRAIRDTGYDSWLMVELDNYDGDPAEAARISKEYLDGMLAPGPVGPHAAAP